MRTARSITVLGFALIAGALLAPVAGFAQGAPDAAARGTLPASAPLPRTFGGTLSVHTIQAFAFTGFNAGDSSVFAATPLMERFCNGSPCAFEAALSLPSGAVVTEIGLEYCDFSTTGHAVMSLLQLTSGGVNPVMTVDTGVGVTSGCVIDNRFLPTPLTIDNGNESYVVEVAMRGTSITNTTRFKAARIYYHLQVSPAPSVATFNDVPTSHPFFAFIEALVAAGITAGCNASPPLFCPDDFVTRKQVAAFFARALGLQFP